ncbi:MAG: ABC transporter ATP-binding protein [Alphaproteobacteria bacterium]|nr:ABC transporter ATP-binding protein [Alphaproteobacteria bacterium]
MLRVERLAAAYGPVHVLHDVSFELAPGESLAVLGANGAGKTTLLRAICGLMVRRQGSVAFAGQEIARRRPDEIVRLGISQVPEGRRLFFPLTVLENLEAGALPLRSGGRAAEVKEALGLVFELFPRLAERRAQIAGTLSGGEQQMLAIARALMGRPRMLLLDEPSVGLAPKVIEALFGVLHTLKGTGLTILLAEQHVPLALDLADRAIILGLGRVAMSGRPDELRDSAEIHRIYLGG